MLTSVLGVNYRKFVVDSTFSRLAWKGSFPPKLKQAKKSGNVVKTISTTTAKDRIELNKVEDTRKANSTFFYP
jgi:hypothetical protein